MFVIRLHYRDNNARVAVLQLSSAAEFEAIADYLLSAIAAFQDISSARLERISIRHDTEVTGAGAAPESDCSQRAALLYYSGGDYDVVSVPSPVSMWELDGVYAGNRATRLYLENHHQSTLEAIDALGLVVLPNWAFVVAGRGH